MTSAAFQESRDLHQFNANPKLRACHLWFDCALSSLRQAKINWANSEVGAVSPFSPFTCEIRNARGFSSHFLSCVSWVFIWNPYNWPPIILLFKLFNFSVDSFFVWMLHGSTKVVVRTVALLAAKTNLKSRKFTGKVFPRKQQTWHEKRNKNTNHVAVSRRVQVRVGEACSSDDLIKG